MGAAAAGYVTTARKQVAVKLGADPSEIIFTSGGTEANNLALLGAVKQKKHVISTAVEHKSVLNILKYLETMGVETTYIRPDKNGGITPAAVTGEIRENTALVSVMLVNNETGGVFPAGNIFRAVKAVRPDILTHTDAVAGFLKTPVDVKIFNADLLTLSGHKIHAPKGAGALYVKKGVHIKPLMYGGGQEGGLRPGTEAVQSVAALGYMAENGGDIEKMSRVMDHLVEKIRAIDHIGINFKPMAPHILSIYNKKYPAEAAVRILEERGIYVSSGSACNKGRVSHALAAFGIERKNAVNTIRVSISENTTTGEIDGFVKALDLLRG